ncbi:hypothetical protein CBR_g66704 [Chara braunii]|uniref:Reverse transcriptase domain-containing protein n=1 Tax=Chara braunii TaxID=69332 RepID=A0A388JPZ9_CHABU|nr:hypothetical protein CBR_g66704 [Chara braunii]|eukprot:GBG59899.1 hypothetical protein CBR_g66704 [Chara braunii]
MVDLRYGTSTTPYSTEQEERVAAILRARKERMEKRELIKQAKMLALLEEQEAKKKQMEEELKKWTKEQEEKMATIQVEVDKEEEEEKQVEEEVPLERRRGGASMSKEAEIEKTTQEWTAHLELGKDREGELAMPQAEREAARRELEIERDPVRRKVKEDERQRAWQWRLSQERVGRLEAAEQAEKDLKAAETRMEKIGEETKIATKLDVLTQSGRFFGKKNQQGMTYDTRSREAVAFAAQASPITTFWHRDMSKGKTWKGRTISGQIKAKDILILTMEEGGADEVPYSDIEWELEEQDSSAGQGGTYAAVAAGVRPQGGGQRYFSKIDLKSGYHQMEVHPDDQYKTAFRTRTFGIVNYVEQIRAVDLRLQLKFSHGYSKSSMTVEWSTIFFSLMYQMNISSLLG